MTTLRFSLNGQSIESEVEDRTLLVDLLRCQLGKTGTHVGCDTSQCGCCSVLLSGKSVKSCTLLARQVEGQEIVTIEGLAQDNRLHPIQEAFIQCHGLQCGFCTPGMIISSACLLSQNFAPTEAEIVQALEGNLCRCTGYVNIITAVQTAARAIASDAGVGA